MMLSVSVWPRKHGIRKSSQRRNQKNSDEAKRKGAPCEIKINSLLLIAG